jgi:vancomycin resistance protein YoaR
MTTAILSRPRALFLPGAARRGFLLGFVGTLVVGLFLFIGLSVGIGIAYDGRVMPGVRVGGVSLTGLDRTAAEARLRDALPSLTSGSVTLVVDGAPIDIPYEQLGRGYRFDAMLDAAFAAGRSDNPLAAGVARLRTVSHATEIAVTVGEGDAATIDATVAGIARSVNHHPVSARVTFQAGRGYVVTPAVDGAAIDVAALRAELIAAVSSSETGDVTIEMATTEVTPAITTVDARAAAIAAGWMTARPLQLAIEGATYPIASDELQAMVTFALIGRDYRPHLDEAALAAWLEALAPQVATTPVSAGFRWDGSGVAGVTPAVVGQELDVAGSTASISAALEARAHGSLTASAGLAMTTIEPPFTTAGAEAAAAKMERLSSWTTYYVPGEGNYWGANISIPADDLDQMIIAPGEWFSFWHDIGPVTLERGYGYGGVIIGGRSVANGALAGGICSTSTTLFNAAMRAGLEIGDRTNHSYYIERYPVGLDATVFATDTYEVDMTFRNDTPDPIVIRSYTGTGYVRFDIWGVPTGRTVTLSAPIITNRKTARETTVLNPSLKPGTSVRREYPHNGFDASVTRVVRDADGNVIWQNTWFSHYNNVNGVTEVGPEPTPKPTQPPTPSPEPSPSA